MNALLRRCFAIGLAGLFVLAPLGDLSACACCSDPGEYVLRAGDSIEEYELNQIQGMTFAPAAKLFLTDASEEEDAKGISSISDQYRLTVVMEARRWRMTFRAKDGKTGTLTLPFPTAMTAFAADIHDGKKSTGNGPLLYKEWRFEGTPEGDGIFQEGVAAAARFTLVFQGRGNRCDNGADFTHWRLAVSGDNAHYAFLGKLTR